MEEFVKIELTEEEAANLDTYLRQQVWGAHKNAIPDMEEVKKAQEKIGYARIYGRFMVAK